MLSFSVSSIVDGVSESVKPSLLCSFSRYCLTLVPKLPPSISRNFHFGTCRCKLRPTARVFQKGLLHFGAITSHPQNFPPFFLLGPLPFSYLFPVPPSAASDFNTISSSRITRKIRLTKKRSFFFFFISELVQGRVPLPGVPVGTRVSQFVSLPDSLSYVFHRRGGPLGPPGRSPVACEVPWSQTRSRT